MLTRFVIAPSGFKESLSAPGRRRGHRRRRPPGGAATPTIDLIPLVDGGEGTARGPGRRRRRPAGRAARHGPGRRAGRHALRAPRLRPDGTAVVEMAAVAGLSLVPRDLRDPGATTTYGVGELIRAALDTGARRILVGCGDSGTSDGGAGALQALGARLLDADGCELPRGRPRVDATGPHRPVRPRPAACGTPSCSVACNPFNVLCGERGVARVFGPQKGATPAAGGGAVGGPGALGARPHPRPARHGTTCATAPAPARPAAWARASPRWAPGCCPASTSCWTTWTWTPAWPAPTSSSPPRAPWTTRRRAARSPPRWPGAPSGRAVRCSCSRAPSARARTTCGRRAWTRTARSCPRRCRCTEALGRGARVPHRRDRARPADDPARHRAAVTRRLRPRRCPARNGRPRCGSSTGRRPPRAP